MEKRNKIILIAIIILTLIVLGICVYTLINNKNIEENDALKFRNEYMELNDKVDEKSGKTYVNVTISDTNTVKYIDEKKAAELLENGTGIIYFGYSTCPWCRSLISTLSKVAENKRETIYYLDILDIRTSFEVDNGKLQKIKDGSKGYYKILELLNENLDDFYLEDEEGNKYDTKEKRLYAPTVVALKNGEVTQIHVGTVDSQESGYDKLSQAQLNELESIIEKLIDSKNETDKCSKEIC